MAERPGFEPGVELPPQLLSRQLPSAARPPLRTTALYAIHNFFEFMAEREGFEPPELSLNGFQDRRLKPLGHLSVPKTSFSTHRLSRMTALRNMRASIFSLVRSAPRRPYRA